MNTFNVGTPVQITEQSKTGTSLGETKLGKRGWGRVVETNVRGDTDLVKVSTGKGAPEEWSTVHLERAGS